MTELALQEMKTTAAQLAALTALLHAADCAIVDPLDGAGRTAAVGLADRLAARVAELAESAD
jgi:hypothetical protein